MSTSQANHLHKLNNVNGQCKTEPLLGYGVALDSLHSHSSDLGGGHQPPPYHILRAYM